MNVCVSVLADRRLEKVHSVPARLLFRTSQNGHRFHDAAGSRPVVGRADERGLLAHAGVSRVRYRNARRVLAAHSRTVMDLTFEQIDGIAKHLPREGQRVVVIQRTPQQAIENRQDRVCRRNDKIVTIWGKMRTFLLWCDIAGPGHLLYRET